MKIDESLKRYFSSKMSLFDQIMALRGECYRHLEGRLTQRICLGGKSYFIKLHSGVGVKEIIKNVLQGRWPVTGARNEWRAIQKLNENDISTPKILAYGQRGLNPARKESFILMEDLTQTISLEDVCRAWPTKPPQFVFKYKLIKEVARIARTMHQCGMNHRDFYLCHFLLDTLSSEREPKLTLIDLHRAQIRRLTPERWLIKDLAGLYFSSKDIGLKKRDLLRFMRLYSGKSLRAILKNDRLFWKKVRRRGEQLYRDHQR